MATNGDVKPRFTSGQVYSIVDGGSKEMLFAQLLDIGRVPNRPTFRIKVRHSENHDVNFDLMINGIHAEDGSGYSWIIHGTVSERPYPRFEGHFNTRKRNGHITFLR